MKKTKITPDTLMVIQLDAGKSYDAIVHEDKLYVSVLPGISKLTEEGGSTTSPVAPVTSSAAPVKKAPVADTEEEDETPKSPAKKAGKTLTDKEMEGMEIDELWDMVDEIAGLRKKITTAEGKNTNKKVRLALLEAWKKSASTDDEEEETPKKAAIKKVVVEEDEDDAPTPPKKSETGSASVRTGVEEVLAGIDSGEFKGDKAVVKLMKLNAEANEDKVSALVDKFIDDADTPLKKFVQMFVDLLSTEAEELAPKKRRVADDEEEETPKKVAPKKKFVKAEDLEVGQKVSVLWVDNIEDAGSEEAAYFDGEVVKIDDAKGALIKYDLDGTKSYIDDENNTKIIVK